MERIERVEEWEAGAPKVAAGCDEDPLSVGDEPAHPDQLHQVLTGRFEHGEPAQAPPVMASSHTTVGASSVSVVLPSRTTSRAGAGSPRSCRGSGTLGLEQRGADLGGHFLLHRGRHMAIQVREHCRVGVAQPLGRDLRRHAVGEHERGARVPQAVRREPRQVQLAGEPAQHPR